MKKNEKILAFLSFAMYFLTGAACIVVGSSLPHLVKMYDLPMDRVVLLGSAYALGRLATVYGTGKLSEKIGPMKTLALGVILVAIFLLGIPTVVNFYAGLLFAALGGAGMGAQDTVCPVLLSIAFKKNYSGSLSAGQALFGLGCFTTPFLVGVMLSGKLPFYYSYYVLLLVPIIMLIMIPFAKIETNESSGEEEETLKPIYMKNKFLAYASIFVGCAAYCAVVNAIGLYTSSYAENLGFSPATSAFMLTVYNVGAFVGSFSFIFILERVKPQLIMILNNLLALGAMLVVIFVPNEVAFFGGLAVAGFFLGVQFSVIVAIATRIGYEHISVASSLVAIVAGGSDILTPIITGFLVGHMGIKISYWYVVLMIVITILASIVLQMKTTEKSLEA